MNIVISSHGSALRVKDGAFLIVHSEGQHLVAPHQVKSITLHKGAQVSTDAVMLAVQNQIDLLFVDAQGMPVGRVWSVKFGSISEIRQKQVEFLFSAASVEFVKVLLIEKINRQAALLLMYKPNDGSRLDHVIQKSLNAMLDHQGKIRRITGSVVADVAPSLRGWEGAAGKRYFEAVSELLPENFRFEKRSYHPPLDPFNAALNYGYGILYGKVEGALIKAGIDPYIGVFHRDQYNRPALAFDVIEIFRHWVDYVIIQLFRHEALSSDCFVIKDNGCWLEAPGRRLVVQAVHEYLNEIIELEGKSRSRITHLDLYAQKLARKFQHFNAPF